MPQLESAQASDPRQARGRQWRRNRAQHLRVTRSTWGRMDSRLECQPGGWSAQRRATKSSIRPLTCSSNWPSLMDNWTPMWSLRIGRKSGSPSSTSASQPSQSRASRQASTAQLQHCVRITSQNTGTAGTPSESCAPGPALALSSNGSHYLGTSRLIAPCSKRSEGPSIRQERLASSLAAHARRVRLWRCVDDRLADRRSWPAGLGGARGTGIEEERG